MVLIRKEKPGDEIHIFQVNNAAFEASTEADIVDLLRKNCPEGISFVAEIDEKVVGHILFTPVVIHTEFNHISGMGLAPMAVLPEYQRKGIGSALVQTGVSELEKLGTPFVVVLGHPDFYPKFGFEKASLYGIQSEYPGVPYEAFMILIFNQVSLKDIHGVAHQRPEFSIAI